MSIYHDYDKNLIKQETAKNGIVDGNKRVGITVMLLLLNLNGYTLQYSQKELIVMGISIADRSIDEVSIKEWINQNKRKN